MPVSNPLPGIPLVESPIFNLLVQSPDWTDEERRIATDLHERGFAVIDFPDPEIDQRIERVLRKFAPRFGIDLDDRQSIKNNGANRRVQDAWREDEDVRAIAANPELLRLLGRLYGRAAIPFQTLNFPVGTEQALHSDSNHFSSIPERFMCGVWLAMEDVHPDAGPLTYAPGSHKWPVLSNLMIGRRAQGSRAQSAQTPFENAWTAMLTAAGTEQEVFCARKGQALIWAANLLHGGSRQHDGTRTRWSQVTHYYFDDCVYYTPGHSDEPTGFLDLREITNVATGELQRNRFLNEDFAEARRQALLDQDRRRRWPWQRSKRSDHGRDQDLGALPEDFDPAAYYQLNPDVAASGMDAASHYRRHGHREGRAYRQG
ncbi:phytanoyl-CoA dioxygenase family protein [Sphingomonas sp. BN140010]|uniref:Phytanoyl-CoA dioxygenase family protein n=1 Tax=Sphingomonas arvum TaxID=2992113 RepID=A0ABT3JC85_9SPHN|nr:phytanoyl-CoA dioxygenase family protein [Sphingomonas sp. BN140010]MCW3796674.1 phytanoyl-CoA dioxygenase family protein [Sphingomonas sp. BN140010]